MAIAGYKLRLNGGAYANYEIDVGLVFEYLLTGLAASTEYAVEVAAYDEDGLQSAWSPVVTATTDAAPVMTMIIDGSGNALIDSGGNALFAEL